MEPERLGPPDPGNGAAAPPAMPPPSPPAVRDEWAVSDVRTLLGLPEEEIHLRDYWEVLVRHRWTILAFLAAVVLTTALVTFVMTPLYRATVLLEIRHENPKVMAFQDVVELAQSQREFFQTQYDVLRSRNLASRVIDALGLAADPAFNPPAADRGPLRRLLRAARQLVARGTAPADPALEGQQRLVETFLDHTAVNPRRNSYLVEVSFSSPSPTLAARVADAIAEHYVALALDQRLDARSSAPRRTSRRSRRRTRSSPWTRRRTSPTASWPISTRR
jgi:succinoglycan biosynthesis transport protein ExoP